MTAYVVPVGVFVHLLRETLESDPFYSDLWLEGEVTDLSRSAAGHYYFTLRDGNGSLKCVLFRGQALRQPRPPRMGDQLIAHGMLSIYPASGSLQLVADLVRPAGLGMASLELEYLRQRLAAEGLFDESRKRPLPGAPHVVGVVTSAHGAAWPDIQDAVARRYPLTSLLLAPARVQGDGAAESIVVALEQLQADGRAEVVILARGGGAADDLSAFNDERVVRAVFACAVPVVTGIGHATDRTLAEDAADVRAATPTAAAELCVPSIAELQERVGSLVDWLRWHAASRRDDARLASASATVRLDAAGPYLRIVRERSVVNATSRRMSAASRAALAGSASQTTAARVMLRALDPGAVLRRGYASLSHSVDGSPLFSVAQAVPGEPLTARLGDGALHAVVDRAESAVSRVALKR